MRNAAIVLAVLAAACSQVWAQEENRKILTIEVGDAVTVGSFTAQDATIDVETEYANPQGAVELKTGGRSLSARVMRRARTSSPVNGVVTMATAMARPTRSERT